MATLEEISNKINSLRGDMSFRRVLNKNLNYLAQGRRAQHDFVVRANIRTLRSGPNRGKVRVDGAVIVMYGKRLKSKSMIASALVRRSDRLLSTLDRLAETLRTSGY